MKIENQPRDDQQTNLIVELEQIEFDKYIQQAARKISREAKIAGFRPGKAPFDVVKRVYGMEMIEKQAIELAVDEVYPKAIEEFGINPSGPGSLDNILNTQPPKFSFIIPLAPETQLGDYQSLRQDYILEPVTEKDVDDTLAELQREYATAEPVERPAQNGDLVAVKISAHFTNVTEGESDELFKEMPFQFTIGQLEEKEPWPYPGFSLELVGLSANEEKSIEHTFPEDALSEKMRGKNIRYSVKIENVKSQTIPVLDDEFAKTLGTYETLVDLRAAVLKNMEEYRQKEYNEKYSSELLDKIIVQSVIKYPPHMLDEEIHEIQHSIEDDLAQQRLDLPTYSKIRKLTQEEFTEKELKPSAIKRLEHSLVMDKIGLNEKIDLDKDELEKTVTQNLMQLFNSPGFRRPKNEKEKANLANIVSYNTATRLLNQKILDRLKLIATGAIENETKVDGNIETAGDVPPVEEPEKPAPKKRKSKKVSEPEE